MVCVAACVMACVMRGCGLGGVVVAQANGSDIPNILEYLMSGQNPATGEMAEGGVPPVQPGLNCWDNGCVDCHQCPFAQLQALFLVGWR